MIKPYKAEPFELEDELSEYEFDALLDGIMQLVATGEILESTTPIEEKRKKH
jgi:hypothetical protein